MLGHRRTHVVRDGQDLGMGSPADTRMSQSVRGYQRRPGVGGWWRQIPKLRLPAAGDGEAVAPKAASSSLPLSVAAYIHPRSLAYINPTSAI